MHWCDFKLNLILFKCNLLQFGHFQSWLTWLFSAVDLGCQILNELTRQMQTCLKYNFYSVMFDKFDNNPYLV